MKDKEQKLIACFRAVFPRLSEEQIRNASTSTTAEWDSVAMVTLLNLVAEEFGMDVNWERIEELQSFPALLAMVESGR